MDQQKREDLRVDDVVFLFRMSMGRHSDDLGGLAWGPVPLGRLARCGGIFFGHENNRAAETRVAACEAIGPAGTSVVKAASQSGGGEEDPHFRLQFRSVGRTARST